MQGNRVPIGIDLGTSNTVAFYKFNGQYMALSISADSFLLPSVIEYRPAFAIGNAAKNAIARRNSFVVNNTKRGLGIKYDNVPEDQRSSLCSVPMSKAPDGTVQFEHPDFIVSPVSAATDIIKEILKRVHDATEKEIGKVTVTFPASFKQEQRLALKEAILNAGIPKEDFRIINEPTAAAISYAMANNFGNENILVYDLGGGTFDCTVLQIQDGHFKVLSYDGDHDLGGVSFDRLVEKLVISRCQERYHKSPLPPDSARNYGIKKRKLLKQCEDMKIYLSGQNYFSFPLNDFEDEIGLEDESLDFWEADLTRILEGEINKTINIIDRSLAKADLTKHDISNVLFIGGSCTIKCIEGIVNKYFERDICKYTAYVWECVARGACIISDCWLQDPTSLSLRINGRHIHVDDITSVTLNFQTSDTTVHPFLHSGTRITGEPIEMILYDPNTHFGYTLYNFYEGNSTNIKDCTPLVTYTIVYDKFTDVNNQGQIEYKFSFKVEFDGIISLEISNNVTNKVYLERQIISY